MYFRPPSDIFSRTSRVSIELNNTVELPTFHGGPYYDGGSCHTSRYCVSDAQSPQEHIPLVYLTWIYQDFLIKENGRDT
jgi:hypothetical protein